MAAIPTPITTVRVTAPIRTVPITATVTTRQFTASATAMPRARIMAATADTGTAIGIVTVTAIGIAMGDADSGPPSAARKSSSAPLFLDLFAELTRTGRIPRLHALQASGESRARKHTCESQ